MSGSAKAKGSDADFVQGRSYISDRRPVYSGSGNTDPSMRPSTSDSSRPGIVSGSGTRSGITGASSSSSRSGRIGAPHSFSSGHSDERSRSDNLVGPGSGLRLRKEDVTQAYERFRRLGMPSEITAEVFEQLIIGPPPPPPSSTVANSTTTTSAVRQGLGQGQGAQGRGDVDRVGAAIVMLSKRLVGRQEARRMRGVIANAREEHAQAVADAKTRPVSRIKAPSAGGGDNKEKSLSILEDPMKNAIIKRENAYRGLVGVRKEYEDVRQELLALDAEKRKLEEDVQAKRRMALLMNVLKKREVVRVARFGGDGGLGTLLSDLRKTAGVVIKEHNSLVADLSSAHSKNALHSDEMLLEREAMITRRNAAWKYRYTTETLANLHAIHIRRVRSAEKEHNSSVEKDMDNRLDQLINRLGMHVDQSEKENMKQKLIEVARRRLDRQHKLRWTIQEGHVDEADLDDMRRSIEDKQRRVQEKNDRAAAIGWLCQEYIDSITTFRTETASALSGMLDEERRRVDGYIDTIRDALVQSHDDKEKLKARQSSSFAKEVKDIIGTGRESHEHILEDVKSMIEMVVVSESLMNRKDPKQTWSGASWVGSGSEERNKRVLERKGSKMNYGFELVQDIKTLLADSKRLR